MTLPGNIFCQENFIDTLTFLSITTWNYQLKYQIRAEIMNLKDSVIAKVIAGATAVGKKVDYNQLRLTFNATIVKLTMTH